MLFPVYSPRINFCVYCLTLDALPAFFRIYFLEDLENGAVTNNRKTSEILNLYNIIS